MISKRFFTGRLSALRHGPFFRYWFGSFASVGATQLMTMGQGWLVYELSESALDLGYLGAAASVPTILMTLFGGVLADRLDRRKLMMATSFTTGVLLTILCLLDAFELVAVWHVLLISGLVAFVSGIDWPTRQAIFPLLIEREDMMSAVALNSIIWQSCRMMMPAVGGLLIAFTDTWVVFAVGAAGFFAMFMVVAGLKITMPAKSAIATSTLKQISEGIGFIANNQLFAVLIPLSYVSMFFGMSYMQLMPALSSLLGVAGDGYGYLISATGVGSVVGTLLVGSLQQSKRLGYIMLASAGLAAILILPFALVTALSEQVKGAYYIAMGTIFLVSVCSSVFMITSLTVMQLHVPDQIRGRVMGIHGITYSMIPLGGMLGGIIAAVSSPPVAVAVGALVYLLVVIWMLAMLPKIRGIDGRTLGDDSALSSQDRIV